MKNGLIYGRNNFDLVRLLAATQVMITHFADHLGISDNPFIAALRYFPGVPIFFFVSGFLISASWMRHPSLSGYARNRILRIYPALWGAFTVTALAIMALAPEMLSRHLGQAALWAIAQTTILQMWNPGFLRGFGIGVVNGSLWTIPVELSFYCAVPLIWRAGKGTRLTALLVALLPCCLAAFLLRCALSPQRLCTKLCPKGASAHPGTLDRDVYHGVAGAAV